MASSDLKQILTAYLNGAVNETDADDNQSVSMSRAELKQAMLDAIADTGAHTKNHTHSRHKAENRPSIEDQNREWFEATRRRTGDYSASGGMVDAESSATALNRSFSEYNRTI